MLVSFLVHCCCTVKGSLYECYGGGKYVTGEHGIMCVVSCGFHQIVCACMSLEKEGR